jgi:hypothetical protein
MSHYIIKDPDNKIIGWGNADPRDFSGGLPAGLEWVADAYQPTSVDQPADWYISKGAFFDRFGALKLPILASADLTVQAIILDCTVRQYIDLQGRAADIGAALDILIAKGFAIDKAAILTTKPTDGERYK